MTGPAELLFNEKPTCLKGLKFIIDTGSSYTYISSKTYQTIVKHTLEGCEDGKALPICWKGTKPFKSVIDVKNLLKSITINFTNGRRDTQLHIPPESYLIISKLGNVCLEILRTRLV
ncbi:Aspartic proteinase Asp1 [Cardamine amara subsp. amara]|uniref:Aspartic proteinase Asp1 n=1 Tax=Cardamine amara subsp. amara TaxID=228776 RepID=A0ABD1AT63_CARAN